MCKDRWLHGTWPSTLMPSAWRQGAGVPREDAPRLASLAFLRQCTTPASSGSVLRSDCTTPRLHDQEAKKFSERYVNRPVLEEEVPRRNQYNILYNILSEMPIDSVLRGNFKTCLLDNQGSVTTRHVLLGFGIVIYVFADLSWFVLICQPFLIRSVASSSAAKPTWGSAGLQCAAGRTWRWEWHSQVLLNMWQTHNQKWIRIVWNLDSLDISRL